MGVPALFRWLSRKYPKIISPVVEEETNVEIGGARYEDPNPNGEIDNLYLDMNGIVHPCSHPEHKPPPETEDEMFLDIFKYTDRVLMMARPRKVLMIAVDGVAPRAKMNQQRARRFRSAQDAKINQEQREKEIKEKEARGEIIDDAIKGKKSWDSNSITPGTPFMNSLAMALRYWVSYKLSNDPGWANLQVVISDASVPGEGEHKLMKFIRLQRQDPQYNPNTKHCIYGLDADLIFLGLATHEPHFRVLREDVFANQSRRLNVSDQLSMTQEQKDSLAASDAKKPFLWLHLNVLREYLLVELYNSKLPFPFDLERAIDDWVFICFFAGNDFLPHIPSLDVRDNGIDTLVGCWKRILPSLKNFITCDGNLNLKSVEILMQGLSKKEDEIFRKRYENEKRREENQKRRKIVDQEEKALKKQYLPQVTKGKDKAPINADANMPLMTTDGQVVDGHANFTNSDIVNNLSTINQANLANNDAAVKLKQLIENKNNPNVTPEPSQESNNKKRPLEDDDVTTSVVVDQDRKSEKPPNGTNNKENDSDDNVKMWEPGYNKRYYQTKFGLQTDEEIKQQRKALVRHYLEGISWVLLYYYQGCPSWQWYYPYHYAPFASDFEEIDEIIEEGGIKFTLGKPFKPYEQLMSVMPAASSHTLPEQFAPLMKDPDSAIIDFYPETFEIDMNGAKMAWQGIPLLPFIDEKRLLDEVEKVYLTLSPDEIERNTLKDDELFISCQNKNYKRFVEELYNSDGKESQVRAKVTGLCGIVHKSEEFEVDSISKNPLKEGDMPDLNNNEFLRLLYFMPQKSRGKSMLLNGYISHAPVLQQQDIDAIMNGPQRGPGNRFRSPNDNRDYVNNGPQGDKLFMMYGSRKGGYRTIVENMKIQNQRNEMNQNQGYNNYGNQGYNNYGNQGYNNYGNQGYNNYGNQGYNNYGNGYNNYGNGYNNYRNQGYNNYGNQYNNNGGGRNNYGNNRYPNQNHNSYNNNQNYNNYNNYNSNSGYMPPQNRNGYRR